LTSDYAPQGSSLSLSFSNLLLFPTTRFLKDLTFSDTITHNNAGNSLTAEIGFENVLSNYKPKVTIRDNKDVTIALTVPSSDSLRHKSDIKIATSLLPNDAPRLTLNTSLPGDLICPKLSLNTTTINTATSVGIEGSVALKKENFVVGGKVIGDLNTAQIRSHHLLVGLKVRDTDFNFLAHFNSSAKTPASEWVFNMYHRAHLFKNEVKHTEDMLPTPVVTPPRIIHGESALGAEVNMRGNEFQLNSISWGLGFLHRFHTSQVTALFKTRYNSQNQLGAALKISDFPSFFQNKHTTLDTSVDVKVPNLFSDFSKAFNISAKITF